eukprot:4363111-Amphidinium_carterae.1
MQVWRKGRLPPLQITTRDLGVDTQWSAWRNSSAAKKDQLSPVGLHGVEVGGMFEQHMKDLRASARGALGKGAALRSAAALELMAHGGPTGDPH